MMINQPSTKLNSLMKQFSNIPEMRTKSTYCTVLKCTRIQNNIPVLKASKVCLICYNYKNT